MRLQGPAAAVFSSPSVLDLCPCRCRSRPLSCCVSRMHYPAQLLMEHFSVHSHSKQL